MASAGVQQAVRAAGMACVRPAPGEVSPATEELCIICRFRKLTAARAVQLGLPSGVSVADIVVLPSGSLQVVVAGSEQPPQLHLLTIDSDPAQTTFRGELSLLAAQLTSSCYV